MERRTSKCDECPYSDKKPSQRSKDELAYAACTKPEDFPCHMEQFYNNEDDVMCRGHWEMYHAAQKQNIQPDESAGDRVFSEEN